MALWVKGQSGNPSGRPRTDEGGMLRQMCQNYMPKSFAILRDIIENPNSREVARVKGIQMLWEYGFGKPKQTVAIERAPDMQALNELSSTQLLNQILQLENNQEPVIINGNSLTVETPKASPVKSKAKKEEKKK